MNKVQLVAAVAAEAGLTKAAAAKAVEATLNAIKAGLKEDKNVQLIGFGTFAVAERAARQGVNPRTGEKIEIAAKKNVKFKAGKALVELV